MKHKLSVILILAVLTVSGLLMASFVLSSLNDNVTGTFSDVSERLGNASDRLDTASENVGNASDRLDTASERVGNVSQRVGNGSERLGNASEKLGNASERIDSVSNRTDGQQSPGFESSVAVVGLLAAVYLMRRYIRK
ncbi:PGF-CTERM sorting domain-containing protein [Methanolobus sp.]|uniref:PGF-CTERM sorting domain-containing protein n=1 Tax=Methanolobus sp. TaxID=1874737 RepID=UPI0025EC7D5F|nr:PGF-CTERM sorting domain-containing protein [Methanolobus sp.]